MRKYSLTAILATALVFAPSCVAKLSQAVTDVRTDRAAGSPIEVKAGGIGVLALSVPSLAPKIQAKLEQACPDGVVVNLDTQLLRRDFFVVQRYVLRLTGRCVPTAPEPSPR